MKKFLDLATGLPRLWNHILGIIESHNTSDTAHQAIRDSITSLNTKTTTGATQSAMGMMSAADKKKLDGIATGANNITIDSSLSSTSTNPVQNKIINSALNNKVDTSTYDTKISSIESNVSTVSDGLAAFKNTKGAANGLAPLDSSGKVSSTYLPSYVDDVLEYDAKANFPTTGETGKIYVDKTTNLTWRWSGSAYVEISPSLALGSTSSTAYRGDLGVAAANKAQSAADAAATNATNITNLTTRVSSVETTINALPSTYFPLTGKTLGIAQGGTGATTQSGAFTNIVAPGGIVSGALYQKGRIIIKNNTQYPEINFTPHFMADNGTVISSLAYDAGDADSFKNSRFIFTQASPSSSGATTVTGYRDFFYFPPTENGLTANHNYNIYTSKYTSNIFNDLSTGDSTPKDADYFISQYVGGGTTTTTYHRRPMSALWSYVNSKAADTYLKLSGGTITGQLFTNGNLLTNAAVYIQNATSRPCISFIPQESDKIQMEIAYQGGTSNNSFRVKTYSKKSGTINRTDNLYYEEFQLPECTADRTSNAYYSILTTKSAVSVAQGGTGSSDRGQAMINLLYIGNNKISSTTDDTTSVWGSKGPCLAFFSSTGLLNNQPSQYGYVLNLSNSITGSEVAQLWLTGNGGKLYRRGGNSSGWGSNWTEILDAANYTSYVPTKTGSGASGTWAISITGNAATATSLATARTIQTNLGSTASASFNGTANITPGVTGTLPIANGGTGATTASGARTNLGAFATSGGKITGWVQMASDSWQEVAFTTSDGKYLGSICGDISNTTQSSVASFSIKCHSKDGEGYCDHYQFPSPGTLTSNNYYLFYSTKNIVASTTQPSSPLSKMIWLELEA